MSVPAAMEINLPSPLSTSSCPLNASEKSPQPFQETSFTSIVSVPSEQEEVTEKHVIKGDLTSRMAKSMEIPKDIARTSFQNAKACYFI